jgi:peptidylprolyl isomerase
MADVIARAQGRRAWIRLRRPMRRLLPSLVLIPVLALAACGGDDNEPAAKTTRSKDTEQPSPAEQHQALEDTSQRPHIPKPAGSPPRRLAKEDLVKGKGAPAKPGDTVTVRYVGVTFSTGEEYDASWDRGHPFRFRVGAGRVIKGWDRGMIGMRKGGRRILTIPPELAYGTTGSPPLIGPNETLVLVVDLIGITRRS